MTDVDPQIENDLHALKEMIAPPRDLSRRFRAIAEKKSLRFRFFLPVAVALIVVVAAVSFKDRNRTFPASPVAYSAEMEAASNDIINSIVSDALVDQSIANEANTDVALIGDDSAAMDSFAAAYNADDF